MSFLDRRIDEILNTLDCKVRVEPIILTVKSLQNVEIGNDYYILNTKPELLKNNDVYVSLISDTNKIGFNKERLGQLKDYTYQTFTGHLEIRMGTSPFNIDYPNPVELEFLRIQPVIKRK